MAKPQAGFKNLEQQRTMILIAILAVVAFIVYLNIILRPQLLRVFTAFNKMGKAASDLKNSESAIAKVPGYKANIAAYREKVDYYEKMLPAEQEIPALLEGLSKMAKDSAVKIIAITPILPQENEAGANNIYQELPILINAKSGYHELGSFLSKLENADRFMMVADISVKSDSAAPKKHNVELLILTYILLGSNK